MNRFYLILAAFVMSGCYPGAMLEEAGRSGAEVAPAIPGLIANPTTNITGWIQAIAALSAVLAAGFFGPAAARRVRAFFGKRP